MFGLQFLFATFISNVAYSTAISGHYSWLSISEWYTYELLVTNRVMKNSSSAEPYLHSITHWYGCYCQEPSVIIYPEQVGSGKKSISLNDLKPYITPYSLQPQNEGSTNYKFVNQFVLQAAQAEFRKNPELLICHVPLEILKGKITLGQAKCIAKMHNIPIRSKSSVAEVLETLAGHMCSSKCSHYYTIFTPEKLVLTSSERQAKWYKSLSKLDQKKVNGKKFNKCVNNSTFKSRRSKENKSAYQALKNTIFPPKPPSKKLVHKIIGGFCDDTHPSKFLEAGCAVCGQLKKISDMLERCNVSCSFEPLIREGVTRIE
jgi:hypothetical protein